MFHSHKKPKPGTCPRFVPSIAASTPHMQFQGNIADTYDFKTNSPRPCLDQDGHGSAVSGIAVYGGNPQSNTRVLSKILMVKGFDEGRPITDIMQMIDKTTSFFINKTRVFNLSFSALRPSRALTKMLDEIIHSKGIVVVACAGNISTEQIGDRLKSGETYPDYLQKHPVYFPGESHNAITAGASTKLDSNWIRRNCPSPFTRAGLGGKGIKPDVTFDGRNLNRFDHGDGTITFDSDDVGIKSACAAGDSLLLSEQSGTSLSTPAVATIAGNIIQRYGFASPYRVKSLILSSADLLRTTHGKPFPSNVQGFGVPDMYAATKSTMWRVCYLIQGSFDGGDPNEFHRYGFLFPDNADRVTVTLSVGKPPQSNGRFRYRLIKSGTKITNAQPARAIGQLPVYSTYKATYDVRRGGKGEWTFEINPDFGRIVAGNSESLSYGCVITVESGRNLDVYSPISKWMKTEQAAVDRAQAAVDKKRGEKTTPETPTDALSAAATL